VKKVFLLLLIIGIVLRFVVQYIFPSFNGDEIALGYNIKKSGFIELLYPLKYNQSAPPLFLWFQKLIITISPLFFWISIKILSFVSSVTGIILFYLFIKKYNFNIVFLLMFVIFLFNPFNIYHSLTAKQYTLELTGILFLILYFKSSFFKKYNWIIFLFWCMISNVGLFACTGYLIYEFFEQTKSINLKTIWIFIKKNLLTFLAPLPYVLYFIWYMKQDGAEELKLFMLNYWHNSFIPLNSHFFGHTIYTLQGLWVCFYSAIDVWGMFLMLLMVPTIYFIRKRVVLFNQEITLLLYIVFTHLILYALHMYPFSDRLYLYLSPLMLLLLGSSINSIFETEKIKKLLFPFVIVISGITFCIYCLYFPFKESDVVSLNNKLKNLNSKEIYVTKRAKISINSFNDFTDKYFAFNKKIVLLDSSLTKSNYIISRVIKRIKIDATYPSEKIIQKLLLEKKIILIDKANGYNIYYIK
jgi:hypothetical protein